MRHRGTGLTVPAEALEQLLDTIMPEAHNHIGAPCLRAILIRDLLQIGVTTQEAATIQGRRHQVQEDPVALIEAVVAVQEALETSGVLAAVALEVQGT